MNATPTSTGSIARRLMMLLAGSAAVLGVILFLVVQQFVKQIADESQDNILAASATSILDSVTSQDSDISVDIPYSALSMLGNISDDRVFYQVKAGTEHITGYNDLPKFEFPDNDNSALFATDVYKNESVRIVQLLRELTIDGRSVDVTVTVAQTRNVHASRLSSITNSMILPGLGVFLLAMLLAVYSARSTIKPLKQLADSVARRGPDDLRPVTAPVPSEMAPLVSSLNEFIARLQRTLSRSEDFITEAAHRIRTPLATVRAQAEIALLRVERPENRQSLKVMIRAIDESSRAANQLLDHAMVSFRSNQLNQVPVQLSELTADTINRMRPVADLKDIMIYTRLESPIVVSCDAVLIQSAIRNVVENAIKYSPDDGAIEVELSVKNDLPILCVKDNGTGFPEQGADKLTERFVRGDNVKNTIGSGLGLTIATEVMRAHGGRLIMANKETGNGACVWLYF